MRRQKPGFLRKYFLHSYRFPEKPGFFGPRIPVWSLVCDRHLGVSDAIILESFPDLTGADLVNAWAYADAYPEEIEQATREND